MFAFWLCVFLYTVIPSEGNVNALKYKKQWARCSSEEPFLILRNIVMDKCVSECNIRTACLAVNYWTRRLQCDMFFNDTESPLQDGNNTQPCVFVKKADFDPAYNESLANCTACNGTTACDIRSGQCEIRECRQLLVPNATTKGNILSIGSKIRIYCNEQFAQRPNETLSICQQNGTWSNVPTCHYLLACVPTPTVVNAEVEHGTRTVGDERHYSCNKGWIAQHANHIATKTDPINMSVKCQDDGNWTHVDFTCIADCGNPQTVPFANVSTGINLEESIRTYTCDVGYGANCFDDMTVTCQASGAWTSVLFNCTLRSDFCNSKEACLVELDTDAEWDDVAYYLYQTLTTGQEWWVGLTKVAEDNTWHWMSTDKVPNVDIRWGTVSNGPGEICARLVASGRLNDCGCSGGKHTMCEKSTIP